MFIWTKDSVRLFKNAAEYNQYHEFLRVGIQRFIGPNDSVLDLGCGLGYLSLKLAPHCRSVTAMDIDSEALSVLAENKIKQGLSNIEVIQQDWTKLPDSQQWDVVVVCFFGQLRKDLDAFLKLSNKRVIAITTNGNDPHFLPENQIEHHRERADDLEAFLNAHYKVVHDERGTISFGQPFLSYEEAYAFVKHYRPQNAETDIRAHLDKYLLAVNQEPYQYELPNQKEIGIFVIEKQ